MMGAIKKSSQAFYLLIFFISIGALIFSSLIFYAEKGDFIDPIEIKYYDDDGKPSRFQSIPDTMWFSLVTMTTVGYGDIYPKTIIGRIIGVIICTWGVFIVSFFVVTLNNLLVFNGNEEKAYSLLMRLYYKEQLKKAATLVLGSAFL